MVAQLGHPGVEDLLGFDLRTEEGCPGLHVHGGGGEGAGGKRRSGSKGRETRRRRGRKMMTRRGRGRRVEDLLGFDQRTEESRAGFTPAPSCTLVQVYFGVLKGDSEI